MTEYIAFIITNATFAFVFLLVSYLFYVRNKKFAKESITTTGTVIGYATEEHSSWITPQVQFEDNGKMVMSDANTAKIKMKDCPPGKIVNMKYRRVTFFGTNFYEVKLTDEGLAPMGNNKVAIVTLLIGIVFVIIMFIFLVLGLN